MNNILNSIFNKESLTFFFKLLSLVIFTRFITSTLRSILNPDSVDEKSADNALVGAPDPQKAKTDAMSIYSMFGLPFNWYNPTSWVENEQGIVDLLLTYTRSDYKYTSIAYRHLYRRDLTADLRKYLQDGVTNYGYIEKINHLF